MVENMNSIGDTNYAIVSILRNPIKFAKKHLLELRVLNHLGKVRLDWSRDYFIG